MGCQEHTAYTIASNPDPQLNGKQKGGTSRPQRRRGPKTGGTAGIETGSDGVRQRQRINQLPSNVGHRQDCSSVLDKDASHLEDLLRVSQQMRTHTRHAPGPEVEKCTAVLRRLRRGPHKTGNARNRSSGGESTAAAQKTHALMAPMRTHTHAHAHARITHTTGSVAWGSRGYPHM